PFQTIMIPLVVTAKTLNLKNIFGIIPIYIGLGAPLAIFMYHGFIKGIPLDLEESAAIDGAGPFRIFFTIVLPLLTPITATITILDVLWVWNDFLLPLILLPKQTTIQLAQYSFFGQFKTEFGKALASLVLSSSPIVLFYLFMQKYIIKGIMSGAIKG
ncbi:MAG TPA: carbohydrate ABC transporter permease, partial [Spirochaetota bacterium]|nr:carbohydrate ABC transporter permease [Spirochaetota bacterium]